MGFMENNIRCLKFSYVLHFNYFCRIKTDTVMNIPQIRVLSQQLVGSQFSDVHDLVSSMGMLQAQEYRMVRWAVGMRMKEPSMSAFQKAYDTGRIVRTHLFRCTWQLVAAEDLRWMLKLCADKNRSAIRGYLAYRGRTIDEKEYEYANQLIRQVLMGQKTMRKDELLARLAEKGLADDAHTMSIYLRRAELEGIICSGELDPKQITYALIDERIPHTPDMTREESLLLLARKYFRSHSPATLEDFVWWTNLGIGECRRAIEAMGDELVAEPYKDCTYFIHRDCRVRGGRRQTLLLPSYDEYLLGYKSRHHVLDEAFRHRAHNNFGVFYPVILYDGNIVGNWHPHKPATFFREEETVDISDALLRYRKFMDSGK